MAAQKVSEAEFIALWNRHGGATGEIAKEINGDRRDILRRRRNIEKRLGILLLAHHPNSPDSIIKLPPGRLTESIQDGTILVGSDVHIWPGSLTTAQRAFIHFAKLLKPYAVVINGDLFDGATVSRFPAGMWQQEKRPNVRQELEACQAFTQAIVEGSRGAKHYWTHGNHDARFESRLAALTPEYEGVPGFALKDHFQEWKMCMSLWFDDLVIKHRWKGGLHAPHRNTVEGGKSFVTGHLHSLKVMPWTDYNGTRYGVDCGTLSDPASSQFDYCEDNPLNWRSGFAVLTYRDGKLLMPELAQVWDDTHVQFRGELIPV